MGHFDVYPIFIATFVPRRETLTATHSRTQKQTGLPNHYLIFTLSSELLANKVVIKIFQNYTKQLRTRTNEMYKNCTCLLTLQKVRLFHLTSHLSGASCKFQHALLFSVEGFRKTRTTFPENTYDFFQKHVCVFAERLSCF